MTHQLAPSSSNQPGINTTNQPEETPDSVTALNSNNNSTTVTVNNENNNESNKPKKPTPDEQRQQIFEDMTGENGVDDLDIYQFTAILGKSDVPEKKENHKSKYYYAGFKSIICLLIQFYGTIFIMYRVVENDIGGFCKQKGGVSMRIITTLFTTYLSLTMFNTLTQLNDFGLYSSNAQSFNDLPQNIACWHWVFVGGYTNYMVSCLVIWASFGVIYVTDDVLDLIFNGVALFFIVELDDLMIGPWDRQTAKNILEYHLKSKKKAPEKALELSPAFTVIMKILYVQINIVVLGTMLGAIAAPFWNAICY